MEVLKDRVGSVDVFISNATGAVLINELEDLTERALMKTMQYSAWPTIDYVLKMKDQLGCYPRYIVVISSAGPDRYHVNYDLMAASKASQETLCRYLSYRLRDEEVFINIIRTLGVRTEAFQTTFGSEFAEFIKPLLPEQRMIDEEEVAKATLALCSGMMDGVRGQTITVDRGAVFYDNISRIYQERDLLDF